MDVNDPRSWKVAAETVAPDPTTLRAFLSEYQQGVKRGREEVETTQVAPESAAMNLEAGEVVVAAQDMITLMKRIITTAERSPVGIHPPKLAGKLSSYCSSLMYNLGRVAGYREAGRLR